MGLPWFHSNSALSKKDGARRPLSGADPGALFPKVCRRQLRGGFRGSSAGNLPASGFPLWCGGVLLLSPSSRDPVFVSYTPKRRFCQLLPVLPKPPSPRSESARAPSLQEILDTGARMSWAILSPAEIVKDSFPWLMRSTRISPL